MTARNNSFDEQAVLHELKQFLPALSPGKTFTYRNPLEGFQEQTFDDALRHASEMLGYRTTLSLEEYRSLYNSKRVKPGVLEKVLVEKKGAANTFEWQDKVLMKKFPAAAESPSRIGKLRANWQKQYKTDLDARVHPRLFRILGNYLDHGVSDWKFPVRGKGFLDSMREVESNSFISAFNTPRARNLLLQASSSISDLLTVIVGDETLFKQYLFDQQFAHRGWSGLVATLEIGREISPNGSNITLRELIVFELLLEIDVLDDRLGRHWEPLAYRLPAPPEDLFAPVPVGEKSEVLAIWQEAVEWSYYEGILAELRQIRKIPGIKPVRGSRKHRSPMRWIRYASSAGHRYSGALRQNTVHSGTATIFRSIRTVKCWKRYWKQWYPHSESLILNASLHGPAWREWTIF